MLGARLAIPWVFDDVPPEAVGEVGSAGLHSHVVGLRVNVFLCLLEVVPGGGIQFGLDQSLDAGEGLGGCVCVGGGVDEG